MIETESGRIWLDDEEVIHYRSERYGSWVCPVSQVQIIGEYTSSHGKVIDDYFFVFLVDSNTWFMASFYAVGRDEFLHELSALLSTRLQSGFDSSTEFKSRVLWPAQIAGEALFDLAETLPEDFKGKGKQWLGVRKLNFDFTTAVLEVLNAQSTPPESSDE